MEFKTTLRGMRVKVCIYLMEYLDPDAGPYFEFGVFDMKGEELHLTDAEVEEINEEIIDYMDYYARHHAAN